MHRTALDITRSMKLIKGPPNALRICCRGVTELSLISSYTHNGIPQVMRMASIGFPIQFAAAACAKLCPHSDPRTTGIVYVATRILSPKPRSGRVFPAIHDMIPHTIHCVRGNHVMPLIIKGVANTRPTEMASPSGRNTGGFCIL
jgi:hypothetical protein